MPWFKVDDGLPTHRKVLSLPRGARRLSAVGAWTMGGAWASANLTEGFIPKAVLSDLGIPSKVATDLVACGLWLVADGGFRMHDFLDYNPTSERVQQDRAATAERQRRARERARAARAEANSHAVSHGVSHGVTTPVTHAVSHGPPDPTRPDPTPSSSSDEREDVDVDVPRDDLAAVAGAVRGWGYEPPAGWEPSS